MLDLLANRVLVRLAPGLVPAGTLHRRALAAAAAEHFVDAERLFEAAAAAYRHELRVEPLARLRVHQHMTRARARGAAGEPEVLLEIVRLLSKLDRLEAFDAPHELLDARAAFARWLGEDEGAERAPRAGRAAAAA